MQTVPTQIETNRPANGAGEPGTESVSLPVSSFVFNWGDEEQQVSRPDFQSRTRQPSTRLAIASRWRPSIIQVLALAATLAIISLLLSIGDLAAGIMVVGGASFLASDAARLALRPLLLNPLMVLTLSVATAMLLVKLRAIARAVASADDVVGFARYALFRSPLSFVATAVFSPQILQETWQADELAQNRFGGSPSALLWCGPIIWAVCVFSNMLTGRPAAQPGTDGITLVAGTMWSMIIDLVTVTAVVGMVALANQTKRWRATFVVAAAAVEDPERGQHLTSAIPLAEDAEPGPADFRSPTITRVVNIAQRAAPYLLFATAWLFASLFAMRFVEPLEVQARDWLGANKMEQALSFLGQGGRQITSDLLGLDISRDIDTVIDESRPFLTSPRFASIGSWAMSFAGYGLATGFLQWLLLRTRSRAPLDWASSAAIGWLTTGSLLLVAPLPVAATAGTLLASLCQWSSIRTVFRRAWLWPVLSVVGMAIGTYWTASLEPSGKIVSLEQATALQAVLASAYLWTSRRLPSLNGQAVSRENTAPAMYPSMARPR